MKGLLATLCLTCALALAANAQEGGPAKKHEATADNKAVIKELIAKYDTNKDGKLDKEEISKMSTEDKAKWEKAHPKREGEKKEKEPAQ